MVMEGWMDRWTEGCRRWDQEGDRKGYFKHSPVPSSLASRGKRGMTDRQGCGGAQLGHSSSGVSNKHAILSTAGASCLKAEPHIP